MMAGVVGEACGGDRPCDGRPLYQQVLAGERRLEFGLVGERLGHSHSPAIHAELGSVPYEIVEVPRDRVGELFATRAFKGLNVTMPYKREAAAACDELSDAARRLGNANTLAVRADGTLYGDNTDYHGFARLVAATGVAVAGRSCLVLGDGGAAATVRAVLADLGASEILTASRKGPLTFDVLRAEDGGAEAAGDDAGVGDAVRDLRERVSVIVNATPVGMFPHADDPLLVDLGAFPNLACVCDLVYNPLSTRLVQRARELGVPAEDGLGMLVAQAKRSSDVFLGVERPDEVEDAVLAAVRSRLTTVSLIGMPGCGKSSVGRELAALLGREFLDVDELVVASEGRAIEDIFAEGGEEAFREVETRCTAEATSHPGAVVACGGGVVTRPRNLPFLRQNGPVVLLARGLDGPVAPGASGDCPGDGGGAGPGAEELSDEGRPMSRAKGVGRLREERAPLYHAWADVEVVGVGGPRETAEAVAAALRAGGWL